MKGTGVIFFKYRSLAQCIALQAGRSVAVPVFKVVSESSIAIVVTNFYDTPSGPSSWFGTKFNKTQLNGDYIKLNRKRVDLIQPAESKVLVVVPMKKFVIMI